MSWQIVPTVPVEMAQDAGPARSQRVMAALVQMGKPDVARLKRACGA